MATSQSQCLPSVTNVEPSTVTNVVSVSNPSPPETLPGKRAWKLSELSVLIAAKRADNERTLRTHGRDRIRTGDTRWVEIQSVIAKSGVNRTPLHSKKRWEKLMTDFRKVYDYDLNPGSGQQSYYELGSADGAAKKLPAHFAHELFHLMQSWVPEARAVNPEGNRVMDTGDLEATAQSEAAASAREGRHFPDHEEAGAGSETEYTENIATPGPDNVEVEFETTHTVPNSPMAPPVTSTFVRKKSKGRRESLDEQFKKTNEDFLKFLNNSSEKRARVDEASVILDQEKLNWEKEKHEVMMAQQANMTNAMAAAMNNMSSSFTRFAEEISKKL